MTIAPLAAVKNNTMQQSMLTWLIFSLGFSTFLPVGSTYLTLIVLLPILFFRSKVALFNMDKSWLLLISLILIWPIFTLTFNYNENFWSRYAHSIRFALCIVVALLLKYNEKIYLLKGFVFGGFFAIIIIFIDNVIVALPDWILWHQLLSVQGNGSSQKWIALSVMPGIFVFYFLRDINSSRKYLLFIFAAIIFVVVAYFSISRNSYISLIGCLLAALMYVFRSTRYWTFAVGLMLVLAAFLLFFFNSVSNRFDQFVAELTVYINSGDFNSSVGVRAHMYMTAWSTMLDNWAIGSGLGSWERIWLEASKAYPETSKVNNPHNDFLLFGMESGFVGFVVLVLFFIKIFSTSWKNKNNLAGSGWIIGWGLMVTALVNAPFRDGALGMMLIILAVAFSNGEIISADSD
jgi:O-antigen ligase